jgi:hypothetical protein
VALLTPKDNKLQDCAPGKIFECKLLTKTKLFDVNRKRKNYAGRKRPERPQPEVLYQLPPGTKPLGYRFKCPFCLKPYTDWYDHEDQCEQARLHPFSGQCALCKEVTKDMFDHKRVCWPLTATTRCIKADGNFQFLVNDFLLRRNQHHHHAVPGPETYREPDWDDLERREKAWKKRQDTKRLRPLRFARS